MFDLRDRVALVTGASRGIGRASAVALARAGAHVVVNYLANEAGAAATVAAIVSEGGRAEAARFDVSDGAAVERSVEEAARRLGRLDILVSNAGVSVDQLLLRLRPADLRRGWATNVDGAIYCAKSAVRIMMRQRQGRIIHVTSIVGEAGNAGQAVYAASKAALIGLTKTLAREYASRGVTVNAVAPGFIETDMTARITDVQRKAIVEQAPLGRLGVPDDVAAAVVYLASDEASYVTGHVLRVNGGMYM